MTSTTPLRVTGFGTTCQFQSVEQWKWHLQSIDTPGALNIAYRDLRTGGEGHASVHRFSNEEFKSAQRAVFERAREIKVTWSGVSKRFV